MPIVWPEEVIDSIARRRAVLVIGSGVSANAQTDNGARPPVWSLFLKGAYEKLSKKIPYIKSALNKYDYLAACDYLKTEHGDQWPAVLRASFSTPVYKPAEIHETIFNLDSRIVASLNFDKIYESYAIAASQGSVVVKNYYDEDIRQVLVGSGRYILKPHGDIDTIPKVIFTQSDYSSARVKHANFYEMLSALMHTHTFIMIGCGLSDPDIQIIFEDYRVKFQESSHFMTYATKLTAAEKDLIRRTRGITIIPYSAKNDHLELHNALKMLVNLVDDRRQDIVSTLNW